MNDAYKLKYLVVGTGRCGTAFMARLLSESGTLCTHEAFYTPKGASFAAEGLEGKRKIRCSAISLTQGAWVHENNKIQAESSYMAAPFLQDKKLSSTKIIHVVRNPLKVISSFVKDLKYFRSDKPTNEYEKFIWNYIPSLSEIKDKYSRAAHYYVEWNSLIEEYAVKENYFFVNVESDSSEVLKNLDISSSAIMADNIPKNSRKKRFFDIKSSHIKNKPVREKLLELSKRYGYEI